jgi:hypothetical protein
MRTISYSVVEENDYDHGHFFWVCEQETLHIVGQPDEVNYYTVPASFKTVEEARACIQSLLNYNAGIK